MLLLLPVLVLAGGRQLLSTGQADIAVNSLRGDSDSACADARPVVAALATLVDRNVRQVGNNSSIHSLGVEVGIQVFRQLQFDVAIDAAQRDTIEIDLLQPDDDASIDAFEARSSVGTRNLYPAVDPGNFNCTIDVAGRKRAVNTFREE